MPDVEANRLQWDGAYPWPEGGDEWSKGWGGPEAQWHFTLWPRVRAFLPTGTLLEIAPGFGRWTAYLVDCCDRYVGMDLSTQGIDACRARFAGVSKAEFVVNDGKSLPGVSDASVDFAFSFDSLVHVEEEVIDAYLGELARVLSKDAVAFIHHSNLAACKPVARPLRGALDMAERATGRRSPGFDFWRGESMSAERFRTLAGAAGLVCIGQEIVNWLGGRLIDCISLVTPRGSAWERPNTIVENPYFMAEAASSARAAHIYTSGAKRSLPDARSSQHLGPLSRISSASVGPWSISVMGPLPGRRPRD